MFELEDNDEEDEESEEGADWNKDEDDAENESFEEDADEESLDGVCSIGLGAIVADDEATFELTEVK